MPSARHHLLYADIIQITIKTCELDLQFFLLGVLTSSSQQRLTSAPCLLVLSQDSHCVSTPEEDRWLLTCALLTTVWFQCLSFLLWNALPWHSDQLTVLCLALKTHPFPGSTFIANLKTVSLLLNPPSPSQYSVAFSRLLCRVLFSALFAHRACH